MTTYYLGFLMNRATREEFVAPVVADELMEARRELFKAYPDSRFALLTVYTRAELEHVLELADHWPGIQDAVKPQPSEATPARIQTGGLPKLPSGLQATVEPVETITHSALPGWMQSFVQQQAAVEAPEPEPTQETPDEQPQAMAQMMAEQRPTQAPQSLIERLQMARGEGMPIRREPEPEMAEVPITRNPHGAASVMDILKGIRK